MKKTTKIINDNGYGKSRNDINKENTIIINKIKKKRKNKKIIISILLVLITIQISDSNEYAYGYDVMMAKHIF